MMKKAIVQKSKSNIKSGSKFAKMLGVAFLILLEGFALLTIVKLSASFAILFPLIIPCVLVLAYVFIQLYKSAKEIQPKKESKVKENFKLLNKANFVILFLLVFALSLFMLWAGIFYGKEYSLAAVIGTVGILFLISKVIYNEWEFRLFS